MRLTSTIVLVLFFCINIYPQEEVTSEPQEERVPSDLLYRYVDEFEGTQSVFPRERFVGYKDGGDEYSEGLTIQMSFDYESNIIVPSILIVNVTGAGNCIDKGSKLQFLLSDKSRIELISWNDFNCDGKSYFNLNKRNIKKLKEFELIGVKFVNSRKYQSITSRSALKDKDKWYFRNLLVEVDLINTGERYLTTEYN